MDVSFKDKNVRISIFMFFFTEANAVARTNLMQLLIGVRKATKSSFFSRNTKKNIFLFAVSFREDGGKAMGKLPDIEG